jgi:protein phosphatase
MVDDMSIYRILKETPDLEEQAKTLIHTANENGGRDNITAVVIRPFFDEVKTC